MAIDLVSKNQLRAWIEADPDGWWSNYDGGFSDQLVGYTNGPEVYQGQWVARAFHYATNYCTPTGPTACFFRITADEGTPNPCSDGYTPPTVPAMSWYQFRNVNIQYHMRETYTYPGRDPQVIEGDFGPNESGRGSLFILNACMDSGDRIYHNYYEVSGSLNYPVFESEEDAILWGQLVTQYLDDPTENNLQYLLDQLWKSLNPYEGDPNEEDPGGSSEEGGGDGKHRQPYTPIPIPGVPTLGANSAGFVYMLRMNRTQMNEFANELVSPSIWSSIKAFFADPLDFICGLLIVPYMPESRESVRPKFGDNIFEYAYPRVYQQFTVVDCGSLRIDKYFGSCFDQNPYTKLLVWLPYIGYRELDPDECVGKSLHIVYHCDCMTGDCTCFVMTSAGNGYDVPFDRVIAQYSGNCGVRVPFSKTSFDSAIMASVQLLGGAVGLMAGGAVGGAMGLAAAGISQGQLAASVGANTVQAVNGMKTQNERSGTAGATAGYLSIQYPYLLRTVPNQSLPDNYKDLEGYPSNISGPLSKFNGYIAVETINLNGISATKDELNEIAALLNEGVFI